MAAQQAPLSMELFRKESWGGLPFPPPGDPPNPEIEPASPGAFALQVDSYPLSHWGSPYNSLQPVNPKLPIHPSLVQLAAAAAAKLLQSCLTLCNPRDGSPPGREVYNFI